MKLYNHLNSPVWSQKNASKCLLNGAKTYSEAITKYYFPVFNEYFKGDPETAVITVTTENKPQKFSGYKRIFLFLHECRYRQQPTVARAKQFQAENPKAEVWFIVWESDTAEVLRRQGLHALFLPMAIDVKEVRKHKVVSNKAKNRIIWFGNIRNAKKPFYKYFCNVARENGYTVDTISGSKYNNNSDKLSREEILRCLQYYDYGVGVGICAHEMSALGLKVFIYSYNYYCNCAYSKEDGKRLINKNLCSPEDAHILVSDAIKNMDKMVVIDPVDIRDNVATLKKLLSENFPSPKNRVV